MNHSQGSLQYQVYLLRVWQEQAASSEHLAVWRFSLENPQTKERHGFKRLEEMLTFLAKSFGIPIPFVKG